MRSRSLWELLSINKSNPPYSFKQAKAICAHFQFVKDSVFNTLYEEVTNVFAIWVTPFDMRYKDQAIRKAIAEGWAQPLIDDNSPQLYDVVVVALLLPEREVGVYMGIATYTALHNIEFDPGIFP